MPERTLKLPKQSREATFRPSTFDEATRSVEIVFSTGAAVTRTDWWTGERYSEELATDEKSVRLDRLNKGGPFLKMHDSSDLDSVIGVIEQAQMIKGEGIARVRFSTNPEVDRYVNDVKNGILRNVSVGYRTHKAVETVDKETNLRTIRATDWEPYEVSLVGMPADVGSQVRSAPKTELFDVQLSSLEGESRMATSANQTTQPGSEGATPGAAPAVRTETPAPQTPTPAPVNTESLRAEAVKMERERVSQIGVACRAAKMTAEFEKKLVDDGTEADKARAAILEQLGKQDRATMVQNQVVTGDDQREANRKDGIVESLLHRNKPELNKLTDRAKMYRKYSLLDLARICLEARGVNCRDLNSKEISERAFHSTSDFPEILANVQNKTLRDAYEQSPTTWNPLVRKTTVSDFKQISRAQLGDAPTLLVVPEGGEFKEGTVGEAAEKYVVKTYGRIVSVTRQAIVNDDLGAFSRLTEMFGRRAADLESDLVWAIITSSPNMADGNPYFDALHLNVGTGVIGVAGLNTGRSKMRLQKGLNLQPLNIRPKYLYVPSALEATADQYVALNVAQNPSDVNPFGPKGSTPLQSVVEPRLDANSALIWYLFSDIGAIDILEMAHITGEEGPVIESQVGFDVDGMRLKCRLDVGVKAIDWRGAYRSTGA